MCAPCLCTYARIVSADVSERVTLVPFVGNLVIAIWCTEQKVAVLPGGKTSPIIVPGKKLLALSIRDAADARMLKDVYPYDEFGGWA